MILFNNILCYCKALNNDGNKLLLLDVNPKLGFSHTTNSKGQKISKNIFKKNFLSDLV